MKKIQYKVVKTLILAVFVGGMTNVALADDPSDPAQPKKTHDKPAATTTHVVTHTTTTATTHVAPAVRTSDAKPEDHPRVAEASHSTQPDVEHREEHHFDNQNNRRDVHYEHDNRGWYDEDHHRHDFVSYQGHRGYWNYENGQPVFVSIDLPLPFSINIHL